MFGIPVSAKIVIEPYIPTVKVILSSPSIVAKRNIISELVEISDIAHKINGNEMDTEEYPEMLPMEMVSATIKFIFKSNMDKELFVRIVQDRYTLK